MAKTRPGDGSRPGTTGAQREQAAALARVGARVRLANDDLRRLARRGCSQNHELKSAIPGAARSPCKGYHASQKSLVPTPGGGCRHEAGKPTHGVEGITASPLCSPVPPRPPAGATSFPRRARRPSYPCGRRMQHHATRDPGGRENPVSSPRVLANATGAATLHSRGRTIGRSRGTGEMRRVRQYPMARLHPGPRPEADHHHLSLSFPSGTRGPPLPPLPPTIRCGAHDEEQVVLRVLHAVAPPGLLRRG